MDGLGGKNILKRAVIAIVVILVIIQFIHPDKNQNASVTDYHITKLYTVPENVQRTLDNTCYDCHSNNTRYPWYSNIQPVNWWLNNHVVDGKRQLNFSDFGHYKLLKQVKKLREIVEEVEEGEMPLSSYTLIHKKAVLTADQKQELTAWAKKLAEEIYAKVPPQDIEDEKKKQEARKLKEGK
ncbi:MAG: heme-binding domain-containing protein [Taibaiella sp.]|nr:heme-binding domain-containing protein [Taibaiella sp.]